MGFCGFAFDLVVDCIVRLDNLRFGVWFGFGFFCDVFELSGFVNLSCLQVWFWLACLCFVFVLLVFVDLHVCVAWAFRLRFG